MTENAKFDCEKASFFSIVCYGIHSKLNSWIKNEFEKCIGQKPISFYEYFLDTPITKEQARKLERDEKAYSPFLFRILNERGWIPKMSSMKSGAKKWQDIHMDNNSFDTLKKFWAPDDTKGIAMANAKDMPVMKQLINEWGGIKVVYKKGEKYEQDDTSGVVSGVIPLNRNDLVRYMNSALCGTEEDFQERLPFIQEYSLVVLPWLRCERQKKFNIYTCSISSRNLFFGEVMIFYPVEVDPEKHKLVSRKLEEFKRELKKIVEKLYLPVLVLFENYWEEKLLSEALKNTGAGKSIVCKNVFHSGALKKSKEPLELLFYNIWNDRAKILNIPLTEVSLQQVRDSLPFGNYIIASPGLLNEFKRISFVHKPPEKRTYLSSFLVIGGPGSGKDCMASIIQLLYLEYRFGKRYTINMAALKPGFLSVPLLSGSEFVTESKLNGDAQGNYEIILKGIFKKVWEDFLWKDSKNNKEQEKKDEAKEEQDDEVKAAEKRVKAAEKRVREARKNGTLPVIILDELNSLDIDAQGSLLRVLQNMKVQSLGSIDEYPTDGPKMDFLVVGVVNEPEESLTLETTLHRLSEQREIIGSLATSMLYEKLRGMRRLREDLYHRLIRDGKIDLKPLAERREDIPMLFSFFVKGELPKKVKWFDLWFDLDVFETLMDPRIAWEGNFRQLQSIAKKVVMKSENENRAFLGELSKDNGGNDRDKRFYRIEAYVVEKVLQEDYGIMPKHVSPITG